MNKTIRSLVLLALLACIFASPLAPIARAATPAAVFTVPVATSFSTYVPANRQSAIILQGSDAEGTALTYAISTGPSHGALSGLNTATGAVVYTPSNGYTGADSFTYTVTSGGETSPAGTVTLTVTNQKTRIVDTLTNASGAPRQGKVTFILTQAVASPGGLIPVGASVSGTLSSGGAFDVSLFPSKSLSPQAYYQVYFSDSATLNRELLGIYEIPFSTSTVSLAPYKVLDTNLAARYTFASAAAVEALTTTVAGATLAQLLGQSRTPGKLQYWDGVNLVDSLASQSGATLSVAGNVAATGSITGGSFVGITSAALPSTLENKTLTGATLTSPTLTTPTFSGTVPGGVTVAGTVTAGAFSGNGAGLTGIPGATGSVQNTGSTTIGADTNSDGVGKISFQTKGAERFGVESAGHLSGVAIQDATGSIHVRQYGAKCDGVTDDGPAFLAAINAAITNGTSKTIRVPASTAPCQIATTVTKSLGATYDLVFQGDGSGSVIRLATGASADGFAFTGGASITFRNVAFVGTTGIQDVRYGLKFDQSTKILIEDCAFYGIASAADLILANLSYLYVNRTHFYGCAADGSFNYGIINNTNWSGIKVTDSQFFDYGQLNGENFTKGGIGFPQSWIAARNPKTTLREEIVGNAPGALTTANSQGVFHVEGCFFDEGAGYSILATSDIGSGEPLIERVSLRNNNHNVTQAGGAAIYLYGTNLVDIENSFFGYVYLGFTNAIVMNGAGKVTIKNCLAMQKANTFAVIAPTAGTTELTIINSTYGFVFLQVQTAIDITQGGKRAIKTLAAGNYTYDQMQGVYDLEVPSSISIGGYVAWVKGIGAPAGACPNGSIYSRIDNVVGSSLFVCENGAWVAK